MPLHLPGTRYPGSTLWISPCQSSVLPWPATLHGLGHLLLWLGYEPPTRAVTLYYYFKQNLIRNEYISQYGSKAFDDAEFYIGDVFILLLSVPSLHRHLSGSDYGPGTVIVRLQSWARPGYFPPGTHNIGRNPEIADQTRTLFDAMLEWVTVHDQWNTKAVYLTELVKIREGSLKEVTTLQSLKGKVKFSAVCVWGFEVGSRQRRVQKEDRGINAMCWELWTVTRDFSQLDFAFWEDHSSKLSGG